MKDYSHTQIGYAMLAIYGVVMLAIGYLLRNSELNGVSQGGLILVLIALMTFTTLRCPQPSSNRFLGSRLAVWPHHFRSDVPAPKLLR